MTKTDKEKIEASWREYNAAAGQCANTLYNESQNDTSEAGKRKAQMVRTHDAKRNHFADLLKQHGIIKR